MRLFGLVEKLLSTCNLLFLASSSRWTYLRCRFAEIHDTTLSGVRGSFRPVREQSMPSISQERGGNPQMTSQRFFLRISCSIINLFICSTNEGSFCTRSELCMTWLNFILNKLLKTFPLLFSTLIIYSEAARMTDRTAETRWMLGKTIKHQNHSTKTVQIHFYIS